MMPLNSCDVSFFDNYLVLHFSKGEVLLKIDEIYTIAYAKPSVSNWFALRTSRIGMGILYIATKTAKCRKDLYQVFMSYSSVIKLPKKWLSKIEFYNHSETMKIDQIIYSDFY